MPVTLQELVVSRELTADRNSYGQTMLYYCDGSSDENEIWAATIAQTPAVLNGLVRQRITCKPDGRSDLWRIDVEYGSTGQDGTADAVGATPANPATPEGGKPENPGDPLGAGYDVQITSENVHVTTAYRHVGDIEIGGTSDSGTDAEITDELVVDSPSADLDHIGKTLWILSSVGGWSPGGYRIVNASSGVSWTLDRTPGEVGSTGGFWVLAQSGPNYEGLIGVEDGEIRGTDIIGPKMEWGRSVSLESVSVETLKAWYALIGKVNEKRFYHFAPGEVLYLGASGRYSNQDRWSVTHRFGVSLNRTNLKVGLDLVVPVKRGWEYVWVQYKPVVENGLTIRRASAAHIEELYGVADFSTLGIGE